MTPIRYRKLYLTENWAENNFVMIKEKVNIPDRIFVSAAPPILQWSHPNVLSGEAFWISHNELCIGYHSATNPDIFRPVFSYKRQRLLDKVHYNKEDNDKEKEEKGEKEFPDYSIINPNLRYARKKYLFGLVKKKELPMDCVKIILSFIHINL